MSVFPWGTRVTCALPNTICIGTPGSRVRPRSPLRRDLEGTGQGTHLSDLRTADGPLPPGNIGGRLTGGPTGRRGPPPPATPRTPPTSHPAKEASRGPRVAGTPSPGFAGYSPDLPPREGGFAGAPGTGTPSPGFAGYSPDIPPREAGFAGTPGAGTPSPGFAGYSPGFAGEIVAVATWFTPVRVGI